MSVKIDFQTRGQDRWAEALDAIVTVPNITIGLAVPDVPHTGPRSKGRLSRLDIAKINEHGDPDLDIPARPIFGPAMEKNADGYLNTLERAVRKSMKRGGGYGVIASAAHRVAGKMYADIEREIEDYGHQPALAPSTIDRKGHDQPWVETSELVNSIQRVVEVRAELSDGSLKGTPRFRDSKGRFTKVGR